MAFTVSDFEDLVRLLGEHPEWQARLRPVILGEEILQVPGRMDRVEAALELLGRRTDALTEEVRELGAAVRQLVGWGEHTDGRIGNILGDMLEWKFERNLGNWLRTWVRKPRKVFTDDLEGLDHAIADGRLAEAEVVQLAWSDAVIRALDKETREAVLLAVEVSTTVNVDHVERAAVRSAILRRAGYDGRSFAVGNSATTQARELAEANGTTVVLIRPDP